MYLTGGTIQEIFYTDNPNEGRVKINDNFKLLGEIASVYTPIANTGITLSSSYVDKEKPIGDIDGVNATFTLQHIPVFGSDHVFLNGLLQENGNNLDYILEGKDIVFFRPPLANMRIICSYRV
jgi:hypothetical protein